MEQFSPVFLDHVVQIWLLQVQHILLDYIWRSIVSTISHSIKNYNLSANNTIQKKGEKVQSFIVLSNISRLTQGSLHCSSIFMPWAGYSVVLWERKHMKKKCVPLVSVYLDVSLRKHTHTDVDVAGCCLADCILRSWLEWRARSIPTYTVVNYSRKQV